MSADDRFCPSCGSAYGQEAANRAPSATEVHVRIGFRSGFRFGVGFALGGLIVGSLATLITIILTGAAISAFLSGLGSTGASTFSGTGTLLSQPVELHGVVDVTWTASPSFSGECQHSAAIYPDGRPIDREILVDTTTSTASTGTHVLYGLSDSRYIVDVQSTCTWSFRFKPRS